MSRAFAFIGFAAALAAVFAGDRTIALWLLGGTLGACLIAMMEE